MQILVYTLYGRCQLPNDSSPIFVKKYHFEPKDIRTKFE